jgi:stage III sporulation protein AA
LDKTTLDHHRSLSKPESLSAINLWAEALRFFPTELRSALGKVENTVYSKVIEFRLRVNQPFEVNCGRESFWLQGDGGISSNPAHSLIISPDLLKKTINSITTGSFYAVDDEIAQGYLALPGGHRVGFSGKAVLNSGEIRFIRNISSLNFRIAREVKGIARPILPLLWKEGQILKTLILSPPACGKTTLLRDIIRELSYGVPGLKIPAFHIGLIDERSEVAGSYQGVTQMDVGPRTDILDSCPKRLGVYLLLRSMSPQVIATDEIGRDEDIAILEDIINAGVSFIATAHARNLAEAALRPGLKKILESGAVERLIVLSNRLGIGTIESVTSGIGGLELWPA